MSFFRVDKSTIVHESVHAEDWRNQWYIKSNIATTIPTLEEAEALGWTSQHLWELLSDIANVEDGLCGDNVTAQLVTDRWDLLQLIVTDITICPSTTAAGFARRCPDRGSCGCFSFRSEGTKKPSAESLGDFRYGVFGKGVGSLFSDDAESNWKIEPPKKDSRPL